MNAPPDMLALCGDSSEERGSQTLEDRLRGCKRIFVCGLALDFCVLDTCLNARKLGFEQVRRSAPARVHACTRALLFHLRRRACASRVKEVEREDGWCW